MHLVDTRTPLRCASARPLRSWARAPTSASRSSCPGLRARPRTRRGRSRSRAPHEDGGVEHAAAVNGRMSGRGGRVAHAITRSRSGGSACRCRSHPPGRRRPRGDRSSAPRAATGSASSSRTTPTQPPLQPSTPSTRINAPWRPRSRARSRPRAAHVRVLRRGPCACACSRRSTGRGSSGPASSGLPWNRFQTFGPMARASSNVARAL